MPWAELGLPTTAQDFPGPLKGLVTSLGLGGLFESVRQQVVNGILKVEHDPNFNFYVYSFFMGIAMIAAAIGICVVGREDAEEKTVLPSK
jgi:hypothetical protein